MKVERFCAQWDRPPSRGSPNFAVTVPVRASKPTSRHAATPSRATVVSSGTVGQGAERSMPEVDWADGEAAGDAATWAVVLSRPLLLKSLAAAASATTARTITTDARARLEGLE